MLSKKRLAALVIASTLVVGFAVGGTTYAIFTSSAQNTNNTFAAGTINLDSQRDQGDAIPGPMFYTGTSDTTGKFPYDTKKNKYAPPGAESLGGLAPGDSITRAMNISNTGSIDAVVKQLKATVNQSGETSGAAYNQFIEKLNVKVLYPTLQNKILYEGSLSGLLNGYVDIPAFLVAAYPSGPANITFTVTLDKTADNEIQGHTFVFDFGFYAEQENNNP